jgi:sialate O-acetylesterase
VGNSGVASAIDIGDEKDIHPRNKQDVGLRLALHALARDYGQNVVHQGPVLQSATRAGSAMRLKFSNTGGELSLKGESERVFALAGADGKYFWATPKIEGDTVVLSAPQVKEPVSARFGWSNLPRAFLYNRAGLPATPFRTDK